MQNIAISLFDQVLTPKHIEDLKQSSLGLEVTSRGQFWYHDEELMIEPTTTVEQFIEMYSTAKSKHEARSLQEVFKKSLDDVNSSFENHFKLHKSKVFAW